MIQAELTEAVVQELVAEDPPHAQKQLYNYGMQFQPGIGGGNC